MNRDDFDTLDSSSTIPGGPEGKLLGGRYKIIRKLGEGGMGMVYLAEDAELDNAKVAIKFIPPTLAGNPRAIKGLVREAQIARKLSHPNIVRLHDLHTDGHQKFLVMEYIEGRTLDQLLAERDGERLTLEELLPIAGQIAAGLDYAHSLEPPVLHRDLKPSNIMIDSHGVAKILDFGIAREMKDSLTRVTGQETSGTLPYMSPEQLRGQPPAASMDIYSLAAVLYECMVGHPPFHTGDLREQIRLKEAPPLEDVNSCVSSALLRSLGKDPCHRPNSAGELVELLAGRSRTPSTAGGEAIAGRADVSETSLGQTGGRPLDEPMRIVDVKTLNLSTFSQHIDFMSDTFGLYVGEAPGGVTSIEDGAYVMAARPEDYLGQEIAALPKMTEFVAEARIRKLDGPHDQWFGFEFGDRYPGDYYQFLLNGKGVVNISKRWQGRWSDLGCNDRLAHVRRGDAENLLLIARKAGRMHIFVNDCHALTVDDSDIRFGGLGLVVGMGVRAAFDDLRLTGVELAAVFERAMAHWERLEVLEAKELFKYVQQYEPTYKHPRCPVDVCQLIAEPRPDCRKSIIIAVGSGVLCQIYDGLIALRLKQEIDKRGSDRDLEFACVVTDGALIEDKRWLMCPLISVGGHAVNKVTADLTDKLRLDPIAEGTARVQHDIEHGERAVALWGDWRADTERAVDLFISSGLIDRFLSMIWARKLSNGKG